MFYKYPGSSAAKNKFKCNALSDQSKTILIKFFVAVWHLKQYFHL